MKTRTLAIASLTALTALGGAPLAIAQTKPPAKPAATPAKPAAAAAAPAAPVAQPITANIPGICILSREGIIVGSKVGKYVQSRLGQLDSQVKAEINGEETSIENDAKSLEAKKASLGGDQSQSYQQQRNALEQRVAALQQKAQQRQNELQATENKAEQRVFAEASPLVGDQIKAKNCAIVLDANAIMTANQAMDLTPGLVAALDAKITQFDFDREHLDQQAPAAQR